MNYTNVGTSELATIGGGEYTLVEGRPAGYWKEGYGEGYGYYPYNYHYYYPAPLGPVKIDPEQFEELVNRLAVLAGEPDPEKVKLQERVKDLEKQLAAVRKALK